MEQGIGEFAHVSAYVCSAVCVYLYKHVYIRACVCIDIRLNHMQLLVIVCFDL